jgi:hypothetical protein
MIQNYGDQENPKQMEIIKQGNLIYNNKKVFVCLCLHENDEPFLEGKLRDIMQSTVKFNLFSFFYIQSLPEENSSSNSSTNSIAETSNLQLHRSENSRSSARPSRNIRICRVIREL